MCKNLAFGLRPQFPHQGRHGGCGEAQKLHLVYQFARIAFIVGELPYDWVRSVIFQMDGVKEVLKLGESDNVLDRKDIK
jgi:hypothetical protein